MPDPVGGREAEIGIARQGRLRLRWEFEDRGYDTPVRGESWA